MSNTHGNNFTCYFLSLLTGPIFVHSSLYFHVRHKVLHEKIKWSYSVWHPGWTPFRWILIQTLRKSTFDSKLLRSWTVRLNHIFRMIWSKVKKLLWKHDFQLEFDSGAIVGSYLLHNRDIFIHSNGIKYSAADGNLSLISSSTVPGEDKFGFHCETFTSPCLFISYF